MKYFAGDVDPMKARILYAVQGRVSTSLFSGRTLQRFMADRMKARTIELASSHVSLISHPQEITALIVEAASA